MNHAFYWGPVRHLTKKSNLYERTDEANISTTGYWVTGYNDPGQWWAMSGTDHLATFGTEEEAKFFCETTYNLTGAVHALPPL